MSGRPREYPRAELLGKFAQYIADTEIPIAAEFASSNGFSKGLLYDWEEFSDLVKLCASKKEEALERLGIRGELNTSMAIFSLKQLGWSDKQESTLRGDKEAPIVIAEAARKW